MIGRNFAALQLYHILLGFASTFSRFPPFFQKKSVFGRLFPDFLRFRIDKPGGFVG